MVRENRRFSIVGRAANLSAAIDGQKECLGIELAEFIGRYGFHEGLPSERYKCARLSSYEAGLINAHEGRAHRR